VELNIGGREGIRRDEAMKLIAELDDEKMDRAAGRVALMAWRAGALEYELAEVKRSPILGPMFSLQAARMLKIGEVAASAADAPDWPTALKVEDELVETVQGNSPSVGAAIEGGPGTLRAWVFTNVNERHVAATCLAVRLYWLDHGKWPAGLGDLVPRYLSRVPMDMITGGNRSIGYTIVRGAAPTRVDRPLLYFAAGRPNLRGPPGSIEQEWDDSASDVIYGDSVQWRDLSIWYLRPPR